MRTWSIVLSLVLFAIPSGFAEEETGVPHLRRLGDATQLIVDGSPLLIRGGELGNSSGEPDYLRPFWPKLRAMHLNTVVAPVYWDVIEPAEGQFDFASVDGLLDDAHEQGMHLVLLWFGTWKNSMSCYAPAWVKTDQKRFPRAQGSDGRGLEILSPFSEVNRDNDARAFSALMRHLREVDGSRHVVVMVQVENEIGMIPEARDHSEAAETAFRSPVPKALTQYLIQQSDTLQPELRAAWMEAGRKTDGSWIDLFGDNPATEEIFMAWHFGRYVDYVAAAGKKAYPLPMYVNAALIRPGYQPGQYPSAGPLPHLLDIWRASAPSIDFLSPDIYFPNFAEWARNYTRAGNPLFIPEAIRGPDAAANALFAIGGLDAIGFSPFAIESIGEPAMGVLGASYEMIEKLTPLILRHQGVGSMAGLLQESPAQKRPQELRLGDYVLSASFEYAPPPALADGGASPASAASLPSLPAGAIVINTAQDEFLFAGIGVTVTFATLPGDGRFAGILSAEEGTFEKGEWHHLRWLNGDQTHQGRHLRLEPGRFTMQRIKLYRYR